MGWLGFGLGVRTGAQSIDRRTGKSGHPGELTYRDAEYLGNHRTGSIHGVENTRQHRIHSIRLAIHALQDVRG